LIKLYLITQRIKADALLIVAATINQSNLSYYHSYNPIKFNVLTQFTRTTKPMCLYKNSILNKDQLLYKLQCNDCPIVRSILESQGIKHNLDSLGQVAMIGTYFGAVGT
jgi:hypothetical protein